MTYAVPWKYCECVTRWTALLCLVKSGLRRVIEAGCLAGCLAGGPCWRTLLFQLLNDIFEFLQRLSYVNLRGQDLDYVSDSAFFIDLCL